MAFLVLSMSVAHLNPRIPVGVATPRVTSSPALRVIPLDSSVVVFPEVVETFFRATVTSVNGRAEAETTIGTEDPP